MSPLARRPAWRRAGRTAGRVAVVLIVGLPLLAVAAVGSGASLLLFGDLPGTVPAPRPVFRAEPTVVVDTQGRLLGEFREFEVTLPMRPADVPQVLIDAVVTSEDRTFWTNSGIDLSGLARAAQANYTEGATVQGGSTITQQLVRERYLSRDRTVERKFNEILLATRFERDLASRLERGEAGGDPLFDLPEAESTDAARAAVDAENQQWFVARAAEVGGQRAAKEKIVFDYLDSVYFGAGAYGASAAAQTYFRKPVGALSASEAATLAAVIPAPSRFSPRENLEVAEERRRQVLRAMADQGYLDATQLQEALDARLVDAAAVDPTAPGTRIWPPVDSNIQAYPYFMDYVRRYLVATYGAEKVYRGGLQVTASIDPRLQDLADDAVAQGLAGTSDPIEMSLVSVEPATGQVKALVGGRDFNASQVNLALGGSVGMQPGSSAKAFTVAKAFEEGYTAETVYNAPAVFTVPGCAGQCAIRGGAGGPIDMRKATASSTNTYFAQLVLDVGPDDVAELGRRLGVASWRADQTYNLGITLGAFEVSPLEMAGAYGVFANHGVKAGPTPVQLVVDRDGTVLEDHRAPGGERVLAASVADWTTELLRGVVEGGTGRRAAIGRPVAGKTGTAQEYRAAWFVGYTPQLSTAVWMGHRDVPTPLRGIGGFGTVQGGTIPALTFSRFMRPAHEGLPVEQFTPPGPLPSPSSDVRRIPAPEESGVVDLPRDCGGPCVVLDDGAAPSPTTTAPSGDDGGDETDPGPVSGGTSTTTSTAPSGTTTTTRRPRHARRVRRRPRTAP